LIARLDLARNLLCFLLNHTHHNKSHSHSQHTSRIMATTKDPFDHMRAVIRSHGIAACHFPNFEVVRAPDHYPPTRYNNGVRFHAKVTNEKWKGKDWVMSTEGEGYRNQKEAQTALALKITKWFEEDVTRFLKLHIESRIPYPSAVVSSYI